MASNLKPLERKDFSELQKPRDRPWNTIAEASDSLNSSIKLDAFNNSNSSIAVPPSLLPSSADLSHINSSEFTKLWRNFSCTERFLFLEAFINSSDNFNLFKRLFLVEVEEKIFSEMVECFLFCLKEVQATRDNQSTSEEGKRTSQNDHLQRFTVEEAIRIVLQVLQVITQAQRFNLLRTFFSRADREKLDKLFDLIRSLSNNSEKLELSYHLRLAYMKL